MDRIVELETLLRQEVADYSGPAYQAKTYYVEDSERQIYMVIIVPDRSQPQKLKAGVVVMAQIVDDRIVIHEDITDRPLADELIRNGIPREQLVLAYAGETLPDEAEA